MRRSTRFLALLFLGLTLGSLSLLLGEEVREKLPEPRQFGLVLDDPVTIQRVLLPADKLAAEIDRAKQGIYQQMPREEFEQLVQKAARVQQTTRDIPHLVEAIYLARLEVDSGTENLIGSAEWKLLS